MKTKKTSKSQHLNSTFSIISHMNCDDKYYDLLKTAKIHASEMLHKICTRITLVVATVMILLGFSLHAHAAAVSKFNQINEYTTSAKEQKRLDQLLTEYSHWKGTRYRLGGNSHHAIDCSALTKRLYKKVFSIDLPRTTKEQLHRGKASRRKQLRTGDLVFFRTGAVQKHVGIYIGNSRFIHASRSKGVTISNLHNKYWNNRFIAGRHILREKFPAG